MSPREREVALLVADGLGDRAIATRVGLTPGSVNVTVQRICRRLGLAGRAEIPAWVAARRTADDPVRPLRRI